MQLRPIGILKTCYPDKFGVPRQPGLSQSSWGELRIEREFQPELALQGLEEFSHLWLIFGFHLNTNEVYRPKVHPPRLKGETIGVFATRSPHRPNPIGLSLVKMERIKDGCIYVSGPDLVDGTPIFDVKPYLAQVESIPAAQGGWTSDADQQTASVEWSERASEDLAELLKSRDVQDAALRSLIEETIALDPRPVIYRGYEGEKTAKYRQVHAVRIEDGDVHFEFVEPKKARILRVLSQYSPAE